MNNSFNKKDRMCSERKTGSCDRQKKNEAKQHGGVSSPLDFCPDLCPVISVGRPFKTQHIYSEFEVMGELSRATHGNRDEFYLSTPHRKYNAGGELAEQK